MLLTWESRHAGPRSWRQIFQGSVSDSRCVVLSRELCGCLGWHWTGGRGLAANCCAAVWTVKEDRGFLLAANKEEGGPFFCTLESTTGCFFLSPEKWPPCTWTNLCGWWYELCTLLAICDHGCKLNCRWEIESHCTEKKRRPAAGSKRLSN